MSLTAIDYSTLKRVLIIKLRHHGDVLLSTPVIASLKAAHPHLEIDIVVYKDTQEMVSGHPDLNSVFVVDRAWKKLNFINHFLAEKHFLSTLKSRNYDVIFHLTEHWRGARIIRAIRPKYAITQFYIKRATSRIWKNTYSHIYKIPHNPRHIAEVHLDALRCTGIQPLVRKSQITYTQEDAAVLQQHYGLSSKNFIVFHPTSRWLFKTWPVEKCAALINQLTLSGHHIVLTAAPDPQESHMISEILKQVNQPVLNLAGKLTLKQLAAVIDQAKAFIGMDSVPMHIADSFNIPLVALFGPSGDKNWGPRSSHSAIITSDHSCRPCGMDGCAGSKVSDCLTAIKTDAVVHALSQVLETP